MKRFINLFIISIFFTLTVYSQGGIVSFYKVGLFKKTISQVSSEIKNALTEGNFQIVGEYKPCNDTSMYVIAFTRQDLLNITLSSSNRGALASALRIGLLIQQNGEVEASLLNPQYLFYGYLRDYTTQFESELNQINLDVLTAISTISDQQVTPYITSSLSDRELMDFRFTIRNPGFNEPVILKTFISFEEGIKKIQMNLKARKGRTFKVYEIIDRKKQIAVFGVALWDDKKGEMEFLTQLGASHVAAMPYEIILSGRQASILHGKFRFPFYWSDLSMNQYTKIYRTPREIQEIMMGLTN